VLEEPVRILTVPSVGRAAGGLRIRHGEGLRIQDAEKGLWRHGSGAYFHVIRLLQHAASFGPEGLQTEEEFLKG